MNKNAISESDAEIVTTLFGDDRTFQYVSHWLLVIFGSLILWVIYTSTHQEGEATMGASIMESIGILCFYLWGAFLLLAGLRNLLMHLIKRPEGALSPTDSNKKRTFIKRGNLGAQSPVFTIIPPLLTILLNFGFYYYNFGFDKPAFRIPELSSLFVSAPATPPPTASRYFEQGFQHMIEGEQNSAIKAFQTAVELIEAKPVDSLDLKDREIAYQAYVVLNSYERRPQKKYNRLKKAITHIESLHQAQPANITWAAEVAGVQYRLSEYALFVASFAEAEQAALKAMELNPEELMYIRYLPTALLYQSKLEATNIYQEWKNRLVEDEEVKAGTTFGELFLDDLQTLEAAGFYHHNVSSARSLLNDW